MQTINLEDTSQESELEMPNSYTDKEENYRTNVNDLRDIAFLMTQLCLLESRQDLEHLSRSHVRYRIEKGLSGRISMMTRSLIVRLLEGESLSWSSVKKEL